MALIKCTECGHNVSTEAACPNCGAPVKPKKQDIVLQPKGELLYSKTMNIGCGLLLLIIVLILIFFIYGIMTD